MAFTEFACRSMFWDSTPIALVSVSVITFRAHSACDVFGSIGAAFNTRNMSMLTPRYDRVKQAMFRGICHAKIVNSVIFFIFVLVVNMLIAGQFSTKILGHDKPVLQHVCSAVTHHNVTTLMHLPSPGPRMIICSNHASLVGDRSAFTRTKTPLFRSSLCCEKLSPTQFTLLSDMGCSWCCKYLRTIASATVRTLTKIIASNDTLVSAFATANKSRFAPDAIMEGHYCKSSKNTPSVIFSFCHKTHCTSVNWRHNGVY